MESTCHLIAEVLRFSFNYISHSIAVMVLELTFHNKYTDRVGDVVNIFLFPDLSYVAGLGAALLARLWKVVFGGGTLAYFSNTSLILGRQKVAPVEFWY